MPLVTPLAILCQTASFIKSASKVDQCPEDIGLEVAFAGRSNAGKSSALNTLTHARLARTSKTPGRTQLINFFALDEHRRLVDLPGYGYAKVPLELKEHWKQHLDAYLTGRQSLAGVVLVMDIRHPLSPFDCMMLDWANTAGLPVHILLINFFALDEHRRLVDLPGYGYAKVPLELKEHWKQHLDAYLTGRQSLAGVVLVMDIRHPLSPFDCMMLDWANTAGLPVHILLS